MKELTKNLMVAAAAATAMVGSMATADLADYFDTAANVLPNKLSISAFEEVRYEDNIHNRSRNERGSLILKTGLGADIYGDKGDYRYGLAGNMSYDYYDHDSHDMNEFEWNLAPYISGNFNVLGDDTLTINLKSRNKRERYDTSDTRYVRRSVNGGDLVYDMVANEKVGVLFGAEYLYTHYSQKKFKARTHSDYGFSVSPYYRLDEKTKVGLHIAYDKRDYKNDNYDDDNYTWIVNGFVNYIYSGQLNATVEAGVMKKNYDGLSGGGTDDNGRAYDNKNNDWIPNYKLTVNYKANSQFAFRVVSSYGAEDTGSGRGLRTAYRNTFSASWTPSRKLDVTQSVSCLIHDEKNYNTDTTEYIYNLKASYKLNDRVSLYGGYRYDKVHYDQNHDSDYADNEVYVGVKISLK
ncbi:MAG: hypothetical protein IJJ33_19580 [Victivallales bacterium]|nr:hypothetical protein [Victivallales bacterium]